MRVSRRYGLGKSDQLNHYATYREATYPSSEPGHHTNRNYPYEVDSSHGLYMFDKSATP